MDLKYNQRSTVPRVGKYLMLNLLTLVTLSTVLHLIVLDRDTTYDKRD